MDAFSVLLMLIMICSTSYLLLVVYLGLTSKNWPHATGNIIELKVQKARFVSVNIKYEYTVDSDKHIGTRISFMNPIYNTIDELEHDALYKKLKKEPLDIIYSKSCPRISTLKTGVYGWQIIIIIIATNIVGLFWLVTN